MVKLHFLLIIFFAIVSCSNTETETQKEVQVAAQSHLKYPTRQYSDVLRSMPACKNKYDCIVDSLAPFWYGTAWDYNGTTEIPNQGKIACGYFVTTLVRDAGLPVNRIKMAQVVSAEMINKLCNKPIKRTTSIKELTSYVNQFANRTIFILGLDNHTGFVIKDKTGIYFLHSTVVPPAIVKKEILTESLPVTSSNSYYIAALRY
jgi:hypothetical protein